MVPNPAPSAAAGAQARTSKEHLDQLEENVNKSIDTEVDTLLRSYKELVSLATIADKDKFRIAQEAFQAEARADTMVRSVQSLSLLSESLKLSLLLSKSTDPALDDEALDLIKSTELEKIKCAHLLEKLLGVEPSRARDIVNQMDDKPDDTAPSAAQDTAPSAAQDTAPAAAQDSKNDEDDDQDEDIDMEDV